MDNKITVQYEIWSQQLSEWISKYNINQKQLAKRTGFSEKTLSLWKNGKQKITPASIKNLLPGLYDYYIEEHNAYFRQLVDARDVLWWLSLLLYQTNINIIRLGANKNIRDWLFQGMNTTQKPNPRFTIPTNFVPRIEIEREIEESLTCIQGFSHPYYQVVLLNGSRHSGKTTMANKIGTTHWATRYFFNGILLIDANLEMSVVTKILEEKEAWLSDDKNVGLVILDDVSNPEILAMVLKNLGHRMKLLLTASDTQKLYNTLVSLTNFDEVKFIAVNGFTIEESISLVSKSMEIKKDEQSIVKAVVQEHNEPLLLRYLIINAKSNSWAYVYQELLNDRIEHKTQDAINEMLQEQWENLHQAYREKAFLLVFALQESGGSFGETLAQAIFKTDLNEARSLLSVFSDIGLIEKIDETGQEPEAILSILQGQRYRMTGMYRLFVQQQRHQLSKKQNILDMFHLYGVTLRFVKKLDKLTNVPLQKSVLIPVIVLAAFILKLGIFLSSKILGKGPDTMPQVIADNSRQIVEDFWHARGKRLPAELALIHHVTTRIIPASMISLLSIFLLIFASDMLTNPFTFNIIGQSIYIIISSLITIVYLSILFFNIWWLFTPAFAISFFILHLYEQDQYFEVKMMDKLDLWW